MGTTLTFVSWRTEKLEGLNFPSLSLNERVPSGKITIELPEDKICDRCRMLDPDEDYCNYFRKNLETAGMIDEYQTCYRCEKCLNYKED